MPPKIPKLRGANPVSDARAIRRHRPGPGMDRQRAPRHLHPPWLTESNRWERGGGAHRNLDATPPFRVGKCSRRRCRLTLSGHFVIQLNSLGAPGNSWDSPDSVASQSLSDVAAESGRVRSDDATLGAREQF